MRKTQPGIGGCAPAKRAWIAVALALLCTACATPVQRIENFAAAQRMARGVVPSGPSNLVVFRNEAARLLRSSVSGQLATLHIYLEGDGGGVAHAADDPTPADALALRLMARDAQPGAYITRPCAHGNAAATGCSAALWTHARYGVAVLDRMAQAIRRVVADAGKPDVVLIGYDGGGVLAMLLATRVERVVGVITVAAPLDTERWAREHGLDPPTGSLNPARQPPLPAGIAQHHAAGGRDALVSPALVGAAVANQPGAALEVFEDFDHGCCWALEWPAILARFGARLQR